MNKQYSVIVFDLGNTIIKFDHHISANRLANLFRIDSKKAYDLFFDSEVTRAFDKGLISPREFYKRATHHLGIKLPYRDFAAIWSDIFWEDDEACGIVKRLKTKYRLFLISNVNRLHFEHIQKKFDIIKFFDEIILSFMVGAMKPDRIIFEEMIRRAGGNTRDVLYIDDREDLIKEATALGIDSIRYESADKLVEVMKERGVI
ncbi:MAG: HAD family phosphatase [Candidatus Omnitrophica bacterium]|nr:HAD family phosphatase [Candidatus Omnitrophota bacterium]